MHLVQRVSRSVLSIIYSIGLSFFDVNTLIIGTKVVNLSVKHVFHPQISHAFTTKPQSQTKKQPLPTLNPEYQLEKTFPDTPKHKYQNEIPLSNTMKAKFQVEISFLYRKKDISQKNIVFSHWTKV